jgi:hypothetical protein
MDESETISLNHFAFTVPREALDDKGRERIVDFFSGCLDFVPDSRSKNVVLDRNRAGLLRWDLGSTFVAIYGKDDPDDEDWTRLKERRGGAHIGISCTSLAQFNMYLDRIKTYLAKYGISDKIDIDTGATATGTLKSGVQQAATGHDRALPYLHAFYVKPFDEPPIAIEIQFLER